MSLPRFAMPEEDDDSTAPAQFLLKLPESYSRRLASLATPGAWTVVPPPPDEVTAPTAHAPKRVNGFLAALAGAVVGVAIITGGAFAFAGASGSPVGISKRAPKKIEHVVRTSTRQSGVAHVRAVPAPRHTAKAKHKR